MASKELNVKVKHRYDTALNWTTNNPVLLAGELGIESDTKNVKIGDGTKNWNSLSYFTTNIRSSEKNELNTSIANAHSFTSVESTEAGMLSWTNAKRGYICIRTDLNKTFILSQEPASNINNWIELLFPLPDIIAISLKVQNGAVNLIRLINGEEVPQTAFYIRNELTSDDSSSALSASQGKELKRLLDLRYVKPSTGIPEADLESSIQTKLSKVDSLENYNDSELRGLISEKANTSDLDNYMPLLGGTAQRFRVSTTSGSTFVRSNGDTPIISQATSTTRGSYVSFTDSYGSLGAIGIGSAGSPVFRDINKNVFEIALKSDIPEDTGGIKLRRWTD